MDYREEPPQRPEHGQPRAWRFAPNPATPIGVKAIIVTNVVLLILEKLVFVRTGSLGFLRLLQLYPQMVVERGFAWQLVTYAFLHDPTSIMHILFNMLFLYWFGRAIEIAWGTRRFVTFYLGAAALSGLCFCAWDYFIKRTGIPCVGASGAVMACMMVYALWYPNQIILLFFFIPMRIRTFVMLTVVIETFSLLNVQGRTANMAHLGGLLYGYALIRWAPRFLWWAGGRLAARAENITQADDQRLDAILDKIQRQGMQSLSGSERRFLKRMSNRP